MQNKQDFEKLASKAQEACNKQIEFVRELDYVNTRVEVIRTNLSEELKNIDYFIEYSKEIEENVNELHEQRIEDYKNLKTQISSNLHLDKDSFLFPDGSPSQAYNIQLVALQIADTCESCYNELMKTAHSYDNALSDRKEKNKKLFNSAVVLCGDYGVEKIKKALQPDIPQDALQSYADSLKNNKQINVDYKTAKIHYDSLNAAGIKAALRNKICGDALDEDYKNICNHYKQPFNEITDACKNTKLVKPTHPGKMFWGITIGIFLFFTIVYCMSLGIYSDPLSFLPAYIPETVATWLPISIAYIIYFCKSNKYKKQRKQLENLEKSANSFTNQISNEIDRQCDFYKIYERADKEIISVLYEKSKQTEQQGESILKKIYELCDWVSSQNGTLLEYLPSNLDRRLLPKIVELMENGEATDYKSALQQARQDEKTEREYAEQRAIIEREQAKRTYELQSQRRMQEYYEKQRLEFAREQAESQKRAEEYAKQQAQAAERQREAAEAAAKAAEKQAEDTEEFLRRTNDPYYINQWKNGN